MAVFFTSDTHIGHKNIVLGVSQWEDKRGCRDFPTVEEHDRYILEQINKRVKPGDVLWHLGDLGFGCGWKERVKELRAAIKCETVNLVLGNHDHVFEDPRNGELVALFKRVKTLHYGKVAGRSMVLCHYAMRTWPWQHHDSVHLYGHSHGSLPDDPGALSMDVGVDTVWRGHEKYAPYSAEEVFEIMAKKKRVVIDHHGREG